MKKFSLNERKRQSINHGRSRGKRLFIYFISLNAESKFSMIENKFSILNKGKELIECDEMFKELSILHKSIASLSEIENEISNPRASLIFKEFNTILLKQEYPIRLSNKSEDDFNISRNKLLQIIRADRDLYKSLLVLFIKLSIKDEFANLIYDLESENIEHKLDLKSLNYEKYIENIGIK